MLASKCLWFSKRWSSGKLLLEWGNSSHILKPRPKIALILLRSFWCLHQIGFRFLVPWNTLMKLNNVMIMLWWYFCCCVKLQAVRKTAATFAPRASSARSKNPAQPGTTLYSIFEVQAYVSMVIGGVLSFNLLFPSDQPDLWRLMGMWSVWMFSEYLSWFS
jgi:hypothetical protein